MLLSRKYKVYCPECGHIKKIPDPAEFFKNPGQSCDKCGTTIQSGKMGLEEQMMLSVNRGRSVMNAIQLCHQYYATDPAEATRVIGEFLQKANIPLRQGPSKPITTLVLAIIIAVVAGIGIAVWVMLAGGTK